MTENCAPEINAKRLNLEMRLESAQPLLYGDSGRLEQVFWNLIKNAVKFTPGGGRIVARTFREEGYLVVQIQDTGVGFEPDARDRIFNAFEQADQGITRQFGGLGLGLAISKRIVEMHEGTISAESPGKGQGATFTVRLPLAAHIGAAAEADNERPQLRIAGRKLRVLVVEDNADTASMLALVLGHLGHETDTAEDAEAAVALARTKHFDLLISDLGLPGRTGYELMRQLHNEQGGIEGIALSGYGREEDLRKSREAGFREHLTKPIDVTVLERALDRVSQSQ